MNGGIPSPNPHFGRRETRAADFDVRQKKLIMNEKKWFFDQAPNVAAITTRQVIDKGFPILVVVHHKVDHSWAFVCETTRRMEDGRLIRMEEALKLDPTLASIAALPPCWWARRSAVGAPWTMELNTDEEEAEQLNPTDGL
jgi:hypothetical protein